jgi:hypothetical protein
MHTKIFVMYNLKEGVTLDQYKQWSREVDQQITPRQAPVNRFETYEIKGADPGEPKFTIVEDIEVESWEAWNAAVAEDGMKRIVADWPTLADESSAMTLYGARIL